MTTKLKDPASALTHMSFAVLSIPVTVFLLLLSPHNVVYIVSFAIFGAALFLLYTASTVYHAVKASEKTQNVLRKIDHMMIFVLISGTYTPICLIPLFGAWGFTLLGVVWGMTILGILFKLFWIDAPRWIGTALYVIMGWAVVVAFVPLADSIPLGGLVLLISGGIAYTLGAAIYAFKWPRIKSKVFGFHEVFHIFVMAGSALHILLMFLYI